MSSDTGQQHPLGIYYKIWVLLFVLSACSYADSDTVFVRWARDNGAVLALDGLGMLVEQAAESFAIWHGLRPQTLSVISQLR